MVTDGGEKILQRELLKIQVEVEAEQIKATETDDFKRGFDYCCRLLKDYLVELSKVYLVKQ